MADDHALQIDEIPALRAPVLLAAFAGWNDAGQVASYALETLVSAWSPTRFAEIDPETFFDFTESRPTISLGPTGQRRLSWPANVFYGHRVPDHDRDIVVLVGSEPQLRWQTFCRHILAVAKRVDASCLVTIGGFLADVPHTRPPALTGFASTPRLLPQLRKLGVRMSTYEGPTGIVGALSDAWRATNLPSISLWGNVPHYISAVPNPQVSLALLRCVSRILGTSLPLSRLETHARAFAVQVDEALQENPEALEYVRQLEEQQGGEEPPEDAPDLFEALEEFLRTTRPNDIEE